MSEFDMDKFVSDAAYVHDLNQNVIRDFRANGGSVLAHGVDTVLLLHTIGAKSGEPRLSPLAYVRLDNRMLIVGAYAGAPKHPAWVHNLRATPTARIEVGAEAYQVSARELVGAEREATFDKLVSIAPVFAQYQARTSRAIPLFELIRL
ncbi:nitroreductase/quinone reductase family protein [Mycolicibacterium litorale]|nr:nitroreductase/quinone reductase family protein [Mycolicibacterium litorale]